MYHVIGYLTHQVTFSEGLSIGGCNPAKCTVIMKIIFPLNCHHTRLLSSQSVLIHPVAAVGI